MLSVKCLRKCVCLSSQKVNWVLFFSLVFDCHLLSKKKKRKTISLKQVFSAVEQVGAVPLLFPILRRRTAYKDSLSALVSQYSSFVRYDYSVAQHLRIRKRTLLCRFFLWKGTNLNCAVFWYWFLFFFSRKRRERVNGCMARLCGCSAAAICFFFFFTQAPTHTHTYKEKQLTCCCASSPLVGHCAFYSSHEREKKKRKRR